MNIKLYPCFKHLTEFSNIWLYSDPHFSDPEMVYIRKNYVGDEEQIKRINSKVGKKDVLIILGDIGNVEKVAALRGYKILVMGNHDSGASNYKRIRFDGRNLGLGWSDNHLFDEVYEGPVMLNDKILLSHEPIRLPFVLNLHGHDHGYKEALDDYNSINLCAEHVDYTPVSLKALIDGGALSKVVSIHRQTIDEATKRKKKRLKGKE